MTTGQPSVSTPSVSFGPLLRRLRTAAQLTQEEFAERAGVSARLVSDLERGTILRPRRDTIRMLADALRLEGAERDAFVDVARGRAADGAGPPASHPAFPLPPTPLVGRRDELDAASSLLHDPEVRLVTICGPGGVGKTRLALDVATRAVVGYSDGGGFVDLAPVADHGLVPAAIARALGVREETERPLQASLIEALRDKRLLLLLDNCEHVVAAGPGLADLLGACPGVTILATSRKPLRLRTEREFPLTPLPLPNLERLPPTDDLGRVPAVDLFVQRAAAAKPGFVLTPTNARTVAEVAVRLDGLPLALELAAARIKILSPTALLTRLDRRLPLLTGGAHDLPARLQTLRDAVAWSYDLLSSGEQALFRRLATFSGGVRLDAAEAVCGVRGDDPLPPIPSPALQERGRTPPPPVPRPPSPLPFVLDGLAALVDASLLRVRDDEEGEPRFSMLETIREFGLERLAEAGEENEVRGRHASWCLALVEEAEPELAGQKQELWYRRLAADHDNLRAAIGWAISQGDGETALRFTGALYRYWINLGYLEEAHRTIETALAIGDATWPAPHAHTLIGAGVVAFFQGDYERAWRRTEAAQALFRQLGDERGVGYTFGNLGLIADARSEFDRAIAMYEEALIRFRALDDRIHVAYMLNNMGVIKRMQGDARRATALHEESLALSRELGIGDMVAFCLNNLGLDVCALGDYERAEAFQAEALELRRRLPNRSAMSGCLENFAMIAGAKREAARAVRLLGAAATERARLGSQMPGSDRAAHDRCLAEARAQLGEARFTTEWDAGAAMTLEAAIAYALRRDEISAADAPTGWLDGSLAAVSSADEFGASTR